jgi:hypothetical protein
VHALSPFSGSLVGAAGTYRVQGGGRILSGSVLTQQNELLPGVTVIARSDAGETWTISDAEGHFRLTVPSGRLTIRFEGRNITPFDLSRGNRRD